MAPTGLDAMGLETIVTAPKHGFVHVQEWASMNAASIGRRDPKTSGLVINGIR